MADDNKPQSPWGRPQKPKPTGTNKPTGNSPWGRPAGQPDRARPKGRDTSSDLENIIEGFKRGGPRRRPTGGGPRRPNNSVDVPRIPPWVFAVGGLALVLFSSVYTVQGNENAAVQRFGDYVRTAGPGLNFKLPYPIETKQIVDVTTQQEIEVGDTDAESLMVTRDENIVDVEFRVLYIIKDLEGYLFKVDEPDELVKVAAESVVREVVGRNDLDYIIGEGREELQTQAAAQLQTLLDAYEAGVQVNNLQFQKTDPPPAVIDAFDGVVRAAQDAEAAIFDARRDLNEVTLRAEGDALRIVQEAEAYRDRVIKEAEGEAERFNRVYDEYRKAPEVTRQRIYLETIEEIYGDANKIVLDSEAGSGVVPYLPLDQLGNNRGANQ